MIQLTYSVGNSYAENRDILRPRENGLESSTDL